MIDGLKPYPAMKDSGVPWLGEVPEHWAVRRFKYLLRERDVRSSSGSEQLLRVSQYTGVTERRRVDGGDEPDTRAESLVGYKLVEPEDLVVNIMLAWNGSMGVSRVSGITSPAYCVYRFTGSAHPWYFHHLLRSPTYKARIKAVSTGVVESRLRLYSDDLYRLEGLLPPLPEQAAIVRFLDHADRRIRRYIRAKQKLIKLLEEQKQAIIHRAVTRGLDPNVRLKPSGVEWLGDVPEHWEVVPLKFLSERIQNGATPPTSEVAFYDNGVVPWYGPSSCARGEYVGAPVRHLAEAAFTAGRARLIHGPALLVVVIGATAGRMALLPRDGATNQQITSYELRTKRVLPRFVLHQLRGAERWLRSTASTATIPILDGRMVSRLSVAIPSVTEQQSILRRADEDTVDLEKAIDRARREIDLLREYRTRLIADVVTGKLDVREAAARLPDEVEEPEPPDEIESEIEADEAGVGDTEDVPAEAEA